MLKFQWYWKNGANGRQKNAQKKSELLWPWPWKENKKNSLYICSARSRKVFQSFCFFAEKIRCGAKGLSISCYQAVAAFFNTYAQGRSYFWLNSVFHLWHVMNYRVFKMDWRQFKELLLWHVFGLPQIIAWMMLPTRYMNS